MGGRTCFGEEKAPAAAGFQLSEDAVSAQGRDEPSCVFCEVANGEGPPGIVAYIDDLVCVFASRDQRPTNLGHMLVVTRRHYRNLYDLPVSLCGPVLLGVRRTAEAVQRAFDATGSTIRQNNERPGQDVFHIHFHVMPRHDADNNLAARYEPIDLTVRVEQARLVGALLHL